jgi:large subunit ribosomal protein L22
MPDQEKKKGFRAHSRYLMASAFKVRRVADQVRRKPLGDAIALLEALPHKGARLLKKVIQSAAANALSNNKNLDEGMLYVKELQVNEGMRLKRVWPRARGRADRLQKRTCHISVELDRIASAGGEKA